MKVFITKITNEENVNKIKALKEFTHLDIYNFKDEIEVGSDVFLCLVVIKAESIGNKD